MKKVSILLVLILGIALVACGTSQPKEASNPGIVSAKALPTSTPSGSAEADLIRTDSQGAVEFSVQPVYLDATGATIDFEVSMNTHSVDLSMDLATRSTLTTDNGNSVQASSWTGQSGGHHVSGTLSFPSDVNGKSLLDGATKLTLTIKDVDAPERIFTWDIGK